MTCRVRYLNSAGIMRREIPGIDALAKAFPKEWLLYASLNCYPRAQAPMEIDAIVVLEDRVLLLELKDWHGKLTSQGDQWFIGKGSRGRSAVIVAEEKAKKLKTVLKSEIPQLKNMWVDARVVLTASATRDGVNDAEKPYIWTLAEACSIVDVTKRSSLLPKTRIGLLKLYQFESDFDRVTNNAKVFQPLEADWSGYRVTDQAIAAHPDGVWVEHRAERNGEARLNALLRVWSFDRLPPGLNSPDRRRLIAEREMKVYAHLSALESPLIERNAILRDLGPSVNEILTNHYELRALSNTWTTWDRYIERAGNDLDTEDRLLLSTNLLWLLSELHKSSIAHRDLGPRSIWVGNPTRIAISGLMCAQLPEGESVGDWLDNLKGYALGLPEDAIGATKGSGKQRDVFQAGRLIARALGAGAANAGDLDVLPEFADARQWLNRSISAIPGHRFGDAVEMANEFAVFAERMDKGVVDQGLLDRHETNLIPYVAWPAKTFFAQDARRSVYLSSSAEGDEIVVKVWNGMSRNVDAATDLALLRLLESASRVLAVPVPCLPRFLQIGLSPIGPFVAYYHQKGTSLDQIPQLSLTDALAVSGELLSSVKALHDLGCEHGDLAPKNLLFDQDSHALSILDAFDISPIGDGSVRTPSLCPPNWESLSQQCLDRYAALRIVRDLLEGCSDDRLADAIAQLNSELQRPTVETLEVALALLRRVTEAIKAPPLPTFELRHPDAADGFFVPDGDGYFLTRRHGLNNSILYSLVGTERELVFVEREGLLVSYEFSKTSFRILSTASQNGLRVRVNITVASGRESGFLPLYEFVATQAQPLTWKRPEGAKSPSSTLDVPRYWERLMDLEANDRLEVALVEEVAFREGTSIYKFDSFGQMLDFDPDASVDVYLSTNKRIGELDQAQSDFTDTLAIRDQNRRLNAGDSIFLVDRREQTSIDRRNKAVRRILEGESAVSNLIEFLSPNSTPESMDFGIEIGDEALSSYELNAGQRDAFRHLLRVGPVGLLQGPPGTGKTRFIASFVHWLVTQGGAKRILIASQSHEAVNNAIEALVNLFKGRGGKPNLLRIGSKGITDKIRPYHSAELRNRYRLRFEAALRHRLGILAAEKGVPKQFMADVLEVDESVGANARLCNRLSVLWAQTAESTSVERERYASELRRAESALRASFVQITGTELELQQPMDALEAAFRGLLLRHRGLAHADLVASRKVLEIARNWASSLGSTYRNFDEFLAKTRSIITATCVGVGETKIRIEASTFDWVIVDEAARCTPSELAVPIQLGRRILLVGDHLQLMPMIKRSLVAELQEEFGDVARSELVRSDFERSFLSKYGRHVGRHLDEQYRMHPKLCELVSHCFYEPHAVHLFTSDARHTALAIPSGAPSILAQPICWVDTSKRANSHEGQAAGTTTFYNEAEVDAVLKILDSIASSTELVTKLAESDEETPIGIICMYSGQRRRIDLACARRAWAPKFRRLVRIDTVDSYQGKENEIVILSLVRSNGTRAAGHVGSDNRCNVAISRARERLIIVGATSMWSAVPIGSPMRRVLEYLRGHSDAGRVVTADEI